MVDRRREPRHPVAGRVRLWLLDRLGFLDAALVDMSLHGIRLEVSGLLPTRCLTSGKYHRIEVDAESGDRFSALARVRHVTSRSVGLEVVEAVPVERFLRGAPA